jgi:hypothetical protein
LNSAAVQEFLNTGSGGRPPMWPDDRRGGMLKQESMIK